MGRYPAWRVRVGPRRRGGSGCATVQPTARQMTDLFVELHGENGSHHPADRGSSRRQHRHRRPRAEQPARASTPPPSQRVRSVMQSLGAATPARGRPRSTPNYRFGFVLPARAARLLRHDRPRDRPGRGRLPAPAHHRDHASPAQPGRRRLRRRSWRRSTDLDGIALLAPDVPPVKLAINELVRSGVHVVTLFSDVRRLDARDLRRRRQPRRRPHRRPAAGPLPAAATRRGASHCCSPATRFAAEIDRRIGFAQVLEERFPAARLVELSDLPESEDAAYASARQFLEPANSAEQYVVVKQTGSGITYCLIY